jgi:hypothetical protein
MLARRLSCRAPSGLEFPVVLLEDVVIAPETVQKEPGLGWLALERLPRLSIEASLHLERVIDGLRIGCWPFCAPLERWNRAAEIYPCLAIAIDDEAASTLATNCKVRSSDLRLPRQVDLMDRRRDRFQAGSDVIMGDRVRSGSRAVGELFLGIRRALRCAASWLALAACIYYVLGAAGWLWTLRDGISGGEVQSGLVLILAALVFSRITQVLRDRRATRSMTSWTDASCRDRETVISLAPDVYRAGVTLQALALLGFVIW